MTTTTTTHRGRHRRSPWLGFGPVAMFLALLAVLVLTACGGTGSLATADEPDQTPLQAARDECGSRGVTVYDGGATLVVESNASATSIKRLACLLNSLDTPMSVIARLDSTRALDGVQTGSWDGYTATWSYHPDSGLDLIVEEQ